MHQDEAQREDFVPHWGAMDVFPRLLYPVGRCADEGMFFFCFFFAVYSASNVSRMRKDRAGCEPNVLFSSYRESRDQLFVSDTGALRLHR